MNIPLILMMSLVLSQCGDTNSTVDNRSLSEKVDFSLHNIDAPVSQIEWCGNVQNGQETILLLTEKGSIYRSVNRGQTWMDLKSIFRSTGKQEAEGDTVGTVTNILQNPVDKNIMIFQGSHGINWMTKNCGGDITALDFEFNVKEFQFHPTERDWMLMAQWNDCDDSSYQDCESVKEIFVSTDLGQNWRYMKSYIVQFQWAILSDKFYPYVPKERILISYDPSGKGDQEEFDSWQSQISIAYSDDFFKTQKVIVKHGNLFQISDEYLFVAKLINEKSQDTSLLVSDPRSSEYQFKEIILPYKDMIDHSYTILDTSEQQVFLNVNHYGEDGKHGMVYISDSTGVRYSTSLLHNVRGADGICDFIKVESLDGIYIANVYDKNKMSLTEGADNSGIQVESMTQKQKSSANAHFREIDSFRRTLISFDKGGIWQNLVPPLRDSLGKRICMGQEDDCYLHLNSFSNYREYGPVYSTNKAIGIIIGTGGVGKYLPTRQDEINTYLSRDGGLTWSEIFKGSHIYEIGDHGGLIVMAPDQEQTNEIMYSWDFGSSWEYVKISETKFDVENIIIEPTNTATYFVVVGLDHNGKGVVSGIDFQSLHLRECIGFNELYTDASDYESWNPSDNGIREKCLLGHQVTYVRRKQDSKCFNPIQFETPIDIKNCECTEENWECDIGYFRSKDGPCKKSTKNKDIDFTPPKQCNDYFYVPTGYRKVAGDTCEGGVDHFPMKIPCPGIRIISNSNIVYVGVIGILVIIVLMGGSFNSLLEQILDFLAKFKLSGNRQEYKEFNDQKEFNNMVFDNDDNDIPQHKFNKDYQDSTNDDEDMSFNPRH